MPSDQNYVIKLNNEKVYSQPYIIKPMKALGYKADEVGICHGYSMMAIQALLSDDIETFNDRVNYLLSEHYDILASCQILQKKLAAQTPFSQLYFTSEEKKIIALKGFFEGIEIYFQPQDYQELFGKRLHQTHTIEASQRVITPAIESEGGMVAIKGWMGAYTFAAFKMYIFALDMVAREHKHDLAMLITGHFHTVTIIYQAGIWSIYDAEDLSNSKTDLNTFTSKLFEIFYQCQMDDIAPEKNATSCIFIETKLFSTNKRKEQAEKFCETLANNKLFLKTHQITRQIVELKALDHETLAIAAARLEYFQLVAEIAAVGGNLDYFNMDGWSARKYQTIHTAPSRTEPFTMEEFLACPENERIYIFIFVLGSAAKAKLHAQRYKIIEVYNALPDKDEIKSEFLNMTAQGFLDSYFFDSDDLTILRFMTPADKDTFFDKKSANRFLGLVKLIKSAEDILLITELLQPTKQKNFIHTISTNEQLLGLIKTSFQLMRLDKAMPQSVRQLFLTNISDNILLSLTVSTHDFLVILKLLPANRKSVYINKAEKQLTEFYAYDESTSTYIKTINAFKKEFKKISDREIDGYLDKIINGKTQQLVDKHKNLMKVLKADTDCMIMLYHLLQGRYTNLLTANKDLFITLQVIDLTDSLYIIENINKELLASLFTTPDDFVKTLTYFKEFAAACLSRLGNEIFINTAKQDHANLVNLIARSDRSEVILLISHFSDKELSSAIKDANDFVIIYEGTTFTPGREAAFLSEFPLAKLASLIDQQVYLINVFLIFDDFKKLQLLKLIPDDKFNQLILLDDTFFRVLTGYSKTVRNAIFDKLSNALLIKKAGKTSVILQILEHLSSEKLGGFFDDVLLTIRSEALQDDKKILPVLLEREAERAQQVVKPENEIIKQFILLINYVQCQFLADTRVVNFNTLFARDELKSYIHLVTTKMKELEATDNLGKAVTSMSDFFNTLLADAKSKEFLSQLLELFSPLCALSDSQWKSFKSYIPVAESPQAVERDLKTFAEEIVNRLECLPTSLLKVNRRYSA